MAFKRKKRVPFKVETYVNLFKVASDGTETFEDKFHVDVNKPWSVKINKKNGSATLSFFPIGEDERKYELGGGYRWSLGYVTVPAY